MAGAPSGPRTPKKEQPKHTNRTAQPHDRMIPVLGMDPSFRNWAYAFAYVDPEEDNEIHVVNVHTVSTSRSKSKQVRRNSDDLRSAQELYLGLHEALDDWQPAAVISEIPSGSQSATASRGLGVAVGVLASMDRPLIQVMPQEVKVAFTGAKTSSKRDIMDKASALYPDVGWKRHKGRLTNDQEHAADAIAALYAGVQNTQFTEMVSMWRMLKGAL